MVGFVQHVGGDQGSTMKRHHSQCFYGKQLKHMQLETSKLEQTSEGVKIDRIVQKNPNAVAEVVSDKPKLAQEDA